MKSLNKIPLYQLNDLAGKEVGIFFFDFSKTTIPDHLEAISLPHRHDHYSCFFVEEGSIDFYIDFQPVQVNKKSLLVSYPGQVHQFVAHKKCKGIVLFFDAKLTDESARMVIEQSFTKVALLNLPHNHRDWFKKLFELIDSVINIESKSPFNSQLVRSLLDSFIYRAAFFYQAQQNDINREHSTRNVGITKKFRQLLQRNFTTMKKPLEYAAKMNLSVSYLNDTVKTVTGFPLSYFIQQEVVSEAQRLLYYTDMSVKEIAHKLGYGDDKYFIRLFGKVTGSSPAAFRKSKITTK